MFQRIKDGKTVGSVRQSLADITTQNCTSPHMPMSRDGSSSRMPRITKISKMSSSPESYRHRDRLTKAKKFQRERLAINHSQTYRIEQINRRSQENIDRLLKSTSKSHFYLDKKASV